MRTITDIILTGEERKQKCIEQIEINKSKIADINNIIDECKRASVIGIEEKIIIDQGEQAIKIYNEYIDTLNSSVKRYDSALAKRNLEK